MKKKIVVCVFSVLILVTAIVFVVGAISSYNYDIKNYSYSDDKWVGFGAILTLMVGGFVVFYELDLFYTVYYFLVKPKTIAKSILNILSNLTLLLIFFTDYLAHILYINFNIFKEDGMFPFALILLYVILRIVCATILVKQFDKEN